MKPLTTRERKQMVDIEKRRDKNFFSTTKEEDELYKSLFNRNILYEKHLEEKEKRRRKRERKK